MRPTQPHLFTPSKRLLVSRYVHVLYKKAHQKNDVSPNGKSLFAVWTIFAKIFHQGQIQEGSSVSLNNLDIGPTSSNEGET